MPRKKIASKLFSKNSAKLPRATLVQFPCPERQRLTELYAKATIDLSTMIEALNDTAISYEQDVFNAAWEQCECYQRRCSDIRKLIYGHLSSHRCGLQVLRALAPS